MIFAGGHVATGIKKERDAFALEEDGMEYRNLGGSGLKVSALGLGGNTFGWYIDEPASAAVIHRAMESGINFIDTADMYDKGRSEEFLGRALKGKANAGFGRQQIFLRHGGYAQ